MDEFAFRKGCAYGTLLVDVEAGQVVDVLPDRTSETFAIWLREHPGAEIICRDRASASAYTRAVKEAAPHAPEAGTAAMRAGSATSTTTRLVALFRMTAERAANPKRLISSGGSRIWLSRQRR